MRAQLFDHNGFKVDELDVPDPPPPIWYVPTYTNALSSFGKREFHREVAWSGDVVRYYEQSSHPDQIAMSNAEWAKLNKRLAETEEP